MNPKTGRFKHVLFNIFDLFCLARNHTMLRFREKFCMFEIILFWEEVYRDFG
jgi:hypothetical protein